MKISVITPTYKSIPFLKETLDSLFKQTYQSFELIICNDSRDEKELLEFLELNYSSFKDKIKFEQNSQNLGYSANIKKCYEKACGEIIFLLAQDDIILNDNHFKEIVDVYKKFPEVGFTSRPYFWFDETTDNKLRRTPKSKERIISKNSSREEIEVVLHSVGQLSGLSFKKTPGETYKFSPHIFTAHVYPFMQKFLVKNCYFFDYDTIAVRMSSSQTTFLSSIYSPAPTFTWVVFINEIFNNEPRLKQIFLDNFTTNYLGLVQIKNYGYFKDLLWDIFYLVKFRPQNLISPKFWVFALGTILIPRKTLIFLVSWYKKTILKNSIY